VAPIELQIIDAHYLIRWQFTSKKDSFNSQRVDFDPCQADSDNKLNRILGIVQPMVCVTGYDCRQ